jgi:23S rRNA (cytidine1920-2'-O)/16S rRNA (cytidine1409-2'-O)-methyltransferase
VLPAVRNLLHPDGRVVALVKPQFEAGRHAVPRGGVVTDPAVHGGVLVRFRADAERAGLGVQGLIRSPVTGSDGNVEFLVLLGPAPGMSPPAWEEAVTAATEASA